MTIIVDITVREDSGADRPLVDAVPEGVVRIPFVFGSENVVVSCVLVPHDDVEGFRDALHRGGSDGPGNAIKAARTVDEFGDQALVHVTYPRRSDTTLVRLVDAGLDVLEGLGTPDGWTFRVRARDRDSIDRFVDDCVRDGATASVDRIREPTGGGRDAPVLTPAQRRTLHVAYATGYFEVPRGASLVDLSDRLDISDSAVSQRLRRGINSILAERFAEDPPPSVD